MNESWLLIAIPAAAACGCCAAYMRLASTSLLLRLIGGMWVGIAVGWMISVRCGIASSSITWSAGTWLTLDAAAGESVTAAFELNGITSALVAAAGLMLLLINPRLSRSIAKVHQPDRFNYDSDATCSIVIPLLACVAILSSNLAIVLVVWMLLDTCSSQLFRDGSAASRHRISWHQTLLLSSNLFLLFAVLLISLRYHTFSLPVFLEMAHADDRIDAMTLNAGIAVALGLAVSARCGLYPWIVWLKPLTMRATQQTLPVVSLVALLPGIAMAASTAGLASTTVSWSDVASDSTALPAVLGSITAFASLVLALGLKRVESVPLLMAVSVCSQALIAASCFMSTLNSESNLEYVTVALCLVCSLLPAIALIGRIPSGDRLRTAVSVAAGVMIIAGFHGQNALLELIEVESQRSVMQMTFGLPRERVFDAIWWTCAIAQVLAGVCLVRVWFSVTTEDDIQSVPRTTGRRTHLVLAVVCFAALIMPWLIIGGGTRPLRMDAATPAGMLGVVVGRMLFRKNSQAATYIAGLAPSVVRQVREWLYLELTLRIVFVLPWVWAGRVIEFIDRHVFGGSREDGWQQWAVDVSGMIDSLRKESAVYSGLIVLLVLVGLLFALTQAGG